MTVVTNCKEVFINLRTKFYCNKILEGYPIKTEIIQKTLKWTNSEILSIVASNGIQNAVKLFKY